MPDGCSDFLGGSFGGLQIRERLLPIVRPQRIAAVSCSASGTLPRPRLGEPSANGGSPSWGGRGSTTGSCRSGYAHRKAEKAEATRNSTTRRFGDRSPSYQPHMLRAPAGQKIQFQCCRDLSLYKFLNKGSQGLLKLLGISCFVIFKRITSSPVPTGSIGVGPIAKRE